MPLRAGSDAAGATLWFCAEAFQVQTTVVPALMVRDAGLNELLITPTFAFVLGGGCSVAVAEKVSGDPLRAAPVRSLAAAVIVMGPAVTLGGTAAADMPEPFDATVGAATVAPVADHATSTPATALPNSSVTLACTGASAVLICPVWLLPPASASVVGSPAAAVAVKVMGDPLAPLSVA